MARKKKPGRTGGRDTFVVASKVKSYIRSKGLMASSGLPEALSEVVRQVLDKALERCRMSDRKTVRGYDL